MKIKSITTAVAAIALGAFAWAGCSSSSTCGDAGCPDASQTTDTGTSDGATLFGLSDGSFCYEVTAIASGSSDGCALDVASLVGMDLPVTYTASTGTLSVGTDGAIGTGVINNNTGTLTIDKTVTNPDMATCSWDETDDSMVVLTANNTFTVSVVENESTFAAACTSPPSGGTCTSTWKWTMAIDGTKSVSNDCQ